jgi:hypothetical protein
VTVNCTEGYLPQFGIIIDTFTINEQVYFVEDILLTSHYDDHFHAYAVSCPQQRRCACVPLQTLQDHVPLQYHVINYEGELHMFIALRYILFNQGLNANSQVA